MLISFLTLSLRSFSILLFLVSPKITSFTFGQPKHFGAMISIQCILGEGDLPVVFQWEFNGRTMDSGYDAMISSLGQRVSNLMIESVEGKHAGNYTCSARNRAATKSFTANLEVIGTI